MTRHVKSQHLSCQRCSQTFNRRDNYEMPQRVRLVKTTGKRSGGPAKRLKDNTSRVGGALNGTVNEYRLNLEDEQQDASNVLAVLKESTFQMENRINEEVGGKKRAC